MSQRFATVYRALLIALVLGYTGRAATGQCEPQWLYGPGQVPPGTDGFVDSLTTWDPDGAGPAHEQLVVAGNFKTIGATPANAIARWDGQNWYALGAGIEDNAPYASGPDVSALAVYNGELVAAGRFSTASGSSVNNIARWDGTNWQPLGVGITGASGYGPHVKALAIFNGELIAAGEFTSAGGVSVNNIARWNGTVWRPLGAGIQFNTVRCLTVYGGELIAGGIFRVAGGASMNNIARWNGSQWRPLGTGITGSGGSGYAAVLALATYGTELIAAGYLGTAGGVSARNIARWDGAAWQPLGTGTNEVVLSLAVRAGELIAGGEFTDAGGVPSNYVARWNGAAWSAMGTGMGSEYDPWVFALTIYNDMVIAGGSFTTAGERPAKALAGWDGENWQPLSPGKGISGYDAIILALQRYQGELVAGGEFITAGGRIAPYIARWDGVNWHRLGSGMNGPVWALTEFGDELIAGGDFSTAGGVSANHVARWDGVEWRPMGAGLDSRVNSLRVYQGQLFAGGSFHTSGGVTVNHIARWDGMSWRPLETGTNGEVYALTVHGGELIAAGGFTTAGDAPTEHIARWNGETWQPFATGTDNFIYALQVYNGDLVAGGYFRRAGGVTMNGIARWNGTSWEALASSLGDSERNNPGIHALAVSGGELIVGGAFTSAGGVNTRDVARWNGTRWRSLGAGMEGRFSCVFAISDFERELIVAGGRFSIVDGNVSACWVRWGYPAGQHPCDANCDGSVNMFDIQPFIDALTAHAGCSQCAGDANRDGTTNQFDILPFVDLLMP